MLGERHSKDVIVSECKDGATQTRSHSRLDAWTMRRSWSNPCFTGYEIKVSRGDWLNDQKWMSYLLMCNVLYFVCPAKLIKVEECPEQAGLIWATKGKRLYTKKKAPHRDIPDPTETLKYVLMARSDIDGPRAGMPVTTEESGKRGFWKKWLKEQKVDRELGYRVGRTLSAKIENEILDARRKNKLLQEKVEDLDGIKRMIEGLGLRPEKYYDRSERSVRQAIERADAVLPDELLKTSDRLIDLLQTLKGYAKKNGDQP